ncbi:putative transmembrane protein [Gregarina niphandrodes]|uniref:Transmembrane protein n=1 Tax=Gregarina niphandrodes TaxID=110365 RepID=A0A023B1W6_GRENI|nr:putative transmembrane protein [Gregarina niphandrodes]EZG48171.1 putative transmembrane protein [Gregarina niphandrodes]|eukprot:XP_011132129.1 putative transmembrane protein [Gregarina niphandrodes]
MRGIQAISKPDERSANHLTLLASAGANWVTGGLIAGGLIGQIGGAVQGWPMIVASREADVQMITLLGAGAFTLVLVAAMIIMFALRRPDDDESLYDDDYDSEY